MENQAQPLRKAKQSPLRERILDTALSLFMEHGYHNVSVHDIQRAAGVSIGSIYKHFGGKEGVARDLYYQLLGRMDALVESVLAEQESTRGRCRAVIEALFRLTEDNPPVIAFVLYAKHREFLSDEPPICSSAPFVKIRDIVAQGQQRGELQDVDPWIAASVMFGPAIRMIHLRLDGMVLQPLPAYTDQVADIAWRSLRV